MFMKASPYWKKTSKSNTSEIESRDGDGRLVPAAGTPGGLDFVAPPSRWLLGGRLGPHGRGQNGLATAGRMPALLRMLFLLVRQGFVDGDFAALLYRDDTMYVL